MESPQEVQGAGFGVRSLWFRSISMCARCERSLKCILSWRRWRSQSWAKHMLYFYRYLSQISISMLYFLLGIICITLLSFHACMYNGLHVGPWIQPIRLTSFMKNSCCNIPHLIWKCIQTQRQVAYLHINQIV
jgi:hypothetical protein